MTSCEATYTPSGRNASVVTCFRTDGPHLNDAVGQHQGYQDIPACEATVFDKTVVRPAWRRLWTWDEGGAHGMSGTLSCSNCIESKSRLSKKTHPQVDHRLVPCTECGVLYDTGEEPGKCFGCTLWTERAAEYGTLYPPRRRGERGGGFHIRVESSDRLYGWGPGSTGGFGGRKYEGVVTLADGTEHSYGPADSLWSSGIIPVQFRHLFPPNGTIVAVNGEGAPLG